jgi:hypothetical protein
MYAAFLDPGPAPAGADVEDADRRLAESFRLARTAMSPERDAAGSGTRPATGDRDAAGRRGAGGMRRIWPGPLWQPALAFAAIAVASVVLVARLLSPGPAGEGVMRDATVPVAAPALEEPVNLADGAVKLSWTRHPDADAYRVRLLGPDLAELGQWEARDTALAIAAADLPQGIAPGSVVGWRVSALRGGGEIAASSIAPQRR